jgi:hypothetical protein
MIGGRKMKKILFLIIFFLISLNILFAEKQESKKFNLEDGGVVRIMPIGGTLDVQIIYNKASEAPEAAQENLGVNDSTDRPGEASSRFSIKLLDEDGYKVCEQFPSFSEFSLDETDDQPKIILGYQTAQCGINSYNKIASVIVDYSNH